MDRIKHTQTERASATIMKNQSKIYLFIELPLCILTGLLFGFALYLMA